MTESRHLEVGGVPVASLIERFGSPLYLLDAARIDSQAERLRAAFPRCALYYSLKANPSVAVMERLRARGFGCDACGIADLELAALAGWTPEAISLTGVGFSAIELRLAIDRGVWINVDSLTELRRYCAIAPGRPVGLRINPEVIAGDHPHFQDGGAESKPGIALREIDAALAITTSHRVPVATLHAHIGSKIFDKDPHLRTAKVLLGLAREIGSVTTVNLGGGIGAPGGPQETEFPLETFAEELRTLWEDFERETGRTLTIALEPGEYLVAQAGFLASTVRVTKTRRSDDRVSRLAIVDASANLLPATLLYGRQYPLQAAASGGNGVAVWDIYGRTNQAGDRLAAQRTLPELCEGDVLLFGAAGAYAACRASQFNEIPRPAEALVANGTATLIRRAEKVEDLLHLQTGFSAATPSAADSFAGVPPRAQLLRITPPKPSSTPVVHYLVDDTESAMTVDLSAAGIELDASECDVLAAVWTALLAQHVLAEEIESERPFNPLVADRLTPILEMLYDIRCACDRRALVTPPRLPAAGTITPPAQPPQGSTAAGTLLLFSGGVDSTVLLRLLIDAGERVETLHFRVNSHVQLDEEIAARRIAELVGVPLTIVDVRLPWLERLGRRYSRSYGVYPYYNAVPHGRDLLLATLAAMIASRRGLSRLALGYERGCYEKVVSYRDRQVPRHDVESEKGFGLMSAFLRDCVAPEVELIAPLTGVSLYRIRQIAIERFPELFAETQSCFWGRRCESCLKCISTYVMQLQLKREIQPFTRDLLDDVENADFRTFVESPVPAHELPYGALVRYALSRLAETSSGTDRRYWLRRYADEIMPGSRRDLASAAARCLEVRFDRAPVPLRGALQSLIHSLEPPGEER
ncbi:MAG: hypothetical protein GY835_09665 [bacterium]|nr:hypothetical protein [bacterium]